MANPNFIPILTPQTGGTFQQVLVEAISVSTGLVGSPPTAPQDAYKIVRLNANGQLDPSLGGGSGGGGGDVLSVNGQVGIVVLTATDVGADPTGSAATAQTNAEAYASNASNLSSGTVASARLSGTYGISIFGNAATVTNGVYTTGSYADPAWITSLAASKITGLATVATSGAYSDLTGTPNLSVYALLSGATFTGNVVAPEFIAQAGSGVGTVAIGSGDVTHSGYVSWQSPGAGFGTQFAVMGLDLDFPNLTLHMTGGGTFIVPNTHITGTLADGASSVGTSGQVLSSTGAGVHWITISTGSGTVSSGTAGDLAYYATTGTVVSGLPAGTNGQVLTTVGGLPSWQSPATPATLFTKTAHTSSTRVIGTIYQNTTSDYLIVSGVVGGAFTVYCDATATPTTVVNDSTWSGGFHSPFLFIVPPNFYYQITTGTFSAWVEWTINNSSVVSGASTDLSGSRALSTVYQNTSGSAMLVSATLSGLSNGTQAFGYSDSTATPTDVVWENTANQNSAFNMVWMLVPNNHYYEVVCSGAAVSHWYEYVLPFNAVKSTDQFLSPPQRAWVTVGSLDTVPSLVAPCWTNIQGKDLWVFWGGQMTTTGSMIVSVAPSPTPHSYQGACQSMSNNGGYLASLSGLVQIGESYCAGQDDGTPTVDIHWWEYQLG